MKISQVDNTLFKAKIQFKTNEPMKTIAPGTAQSPMVSKSAQSKAFFKHTAATLVFLPAILMKTHKIKKSVKLPS